MLLVKTNINMLRESFR